MNIGMIAFGLTRVTLITLPVEFGASRRAIAALAKKNAERRVDRAQVLMPRLTYGASAGGYTFTVANLPADSARQPGLRRESTEPIWTSKIDRDS